MRIKTYKKITNDEIIAVLEKNGLKASEKNVFFSGKQIRFNHNNLKFRIQNRKSELIVSLIVPVWLYILVIVLTLILSTLIISFILGEMVIVSGGFLVVILAFWIAEIIYKSSKSTVFKKTCSDLERIINE